MPLSKDGLGIQTKENGSYRQNSGREGGIMEVTLAFSGDHDPQCFMEQIMDIRTATRKKIACSIPRKQNRGKIGIPYASSTNVNTIWG
jgi:hypothetical protein